MDEISFEEALHDIAMEYKRIDSEPWELESKFGATEQIQKIISCHRALFWGNQGFKEFRTIKKR